MKANIDNSLISVIHVNIQPAPILIGWYDDHTQKETVMSDTCQFPGCCFHGEKNNYCIRHQIYAGTPIVKDKPKPIAKESKKRAAENRKYRKEVGQELEADPRCHVGSPDCTGFAEGMNHKQKRSPKNLRLKKNLENCCNACNGYIEKNPVWAKENGHQVSRFAKDEEPMFLTMDELAGLPEELYVEGRIKDFSIIINNEHIFPTYSLKLKHHSETFMWGNPSLGSLQLSLAILLDFLPEEQALTLYKKFEREQVSKWPFTNFDITLNFREIIQQFITGK